jgi:hypothetical protein
MSYLHRLFLVICLGAVLEGSDDGIFSPSVSPVVSSSASTVAAALVARVGHLAQASRQESREDSGVYQDYLRLERDLDDFKRELLARRFLEADLYDQISSNPLFLRDREFVDEQLSHFDEARKQQQKEEQDQLNELSRRVSSLRNSFRTHSSGLENENSIDSLIGSLVIISKENELVLNPVLRVPSLRLPDSQTASAAVAESTGVESLLGEYRLGSEVKKVDFSSAQPVHAQFAQPAQAAQPDDRSAKSIRLSEKYVDGDHESDNDDDSEEPGSIVRTEEVLGDNCGGTSTRVPTVALVVSSQQAGDPQPERKNEDHLYEML